MTNLNLSHPKLRLAILLTTALLTVIILATGLSRLELLPGEAIPIAGILQVLSDASLKFSTQFSLPIEILYTLTGCFWVALVASIIAFFISPQVRKQVFKQAAIVMLWFLLLLGLVRFIRPGMLDFGANEGDFGEALPPELPNPDELIPTPPDFIVNPPSWFIFGVTVLLIVLVLGVTWLIWQFISLSRANDDNTLEKLTEEAQQALENLQLGADLKNTVKRCYADMSQILAQSRGLQRDSGMTAREFEIYLAEYGLRNEHIHRLTRLFETVRYGNRSSDSDQEKEAIACLTAIVQNYGLPS